VDYLQKQFAMLEPNGQSHPRILDLPRKYHFGKLYREFYEIWIELRHETGVEFDLLYDPKGWMTLMAHRDQLSEDVMYIHQGGILGNDSMLPRYTRKYHD
jgi:1-aminocyclopropane-1-carboxylate deaminase/D-cysteine desulfhydrase-like pyridoxal-dependent ACC family enzyme